jgi:chromosomal replication initiation ATPase DnaA
MTAGLTAMQLTAIENRLSTLERLLSATTRIEAIQEAIGEMQPRSQYYAVVDASCELLSGIRTVTRSHVMRAGRNQAVVIVRQAAMTILHIDLRQTSTDVGHFFDKDHGTVLHAVKATRDREDTDPKFKEQMAKLRGLFVTKSVN